MLLQMKGTRQPGSKQRRTECPEEAAYLELLRTTDMLSRKLSQLLKIEDLSSNQYNVLRILRGRLMGFLAARLATG